MKSICVYCGSSLGISPVYAEAARALASALVTQQVTLVYGGGNIGLMGVLSDEVMRLGGEVIGVIPQPLLEKEYGHRGITRLHIVKNMHERKAMMADLCDGFIALPGGIGTLEELIEMLTWHQLGFHHKPVGLLNVNGFYDGLLEFLKHLVRQGFLAPEHHAALLRSTQADDLVQQLRAHQRRLDHS